MTPTPSSDLYYLQIIHICLPALWRHIRLPSIADCIYVLFSFLGYRVNDQAQDSWLNATHHKFWLLEMLHTSDYYKSSLSLLWQSYNLVFNILQHFPLKS